MVHGIGVGYWIDPAEKMMFQDEARFGRMVRIKRCWAPVPHRPVVNHGYERQFADGYGAGSPREGELGLLGST